MAPIPPDELFLAIDDRPTGTDHLEVVAVPSLACFPGKEFEIIHAYRVLRHVEVEDSHVGPVGYDLSALGVDEVDRVGQVVDEGAQETVLPAGYSLALSQFRHVSRDFPLRFQQVPVRG